MTFDERTKSSNSFLDIIISVQNKYSTATDGKENTLDQIYPHEFLSLKQYSTHDVKAYISRMHTLYITLTESKWNKPLNFQLAMWTRINLMKTITPVNINLHVQYSLQMSNHNSDQFIALPGVVNSNYVNFITSKLSDNYTIKIYWLHDRFQSIGFQYKNCRYRKMRYNYCVNLTTLRNEYIFLWHIYNYTHWYEIPERLLHTWGRHIPPYMRAKYYNFEERVYYTKTLYQKLVDMTWIEASKLCKSMGGSLPLIRSQEELTELITFLKLSQDMPPVEALYIGLFYSKVAN